jgi:hypothetical protein
VRSWDTKKSQGGNGEKRRNNAPSTIQQIPFFSFFFVRCPFFFSRAHLVPGTIPDYQIRVNGRIDRKEYAESIQQHRNGRNSTRLVCSVGPEDVSAHHDAAQDGHGDGERGAPPERRVFVWGGLPQGLQCQLRCPTLRLPVHDDENLWEGI